MLRYAGWLEKPKRKYDPSSEPSAQGSSRCALCFWRGGDSLLPGFLVEQLPAAVPELGVFGMKRPRHIARDGYQVLDWQDGPGFFIDDLWRQFPDLVVGRYLVNTCYDSGFLTLSERERQEGWRMVGRLAHSPQIHSSDQIPHDQYDEWLVFDHPVQVEEFETMVNYCGFTPIDFWDEKRERFWEQVLRLRPLHVIAENDGVYLLSKDEDLIRRMMKAGAPSNDGPVERFGNSGVGSGPPLAS